MRTLVDLDNNDIERLDHLASVGKRSRASLIREAVSEFLSRRRAPERDAFGLWGKNKVDGLAFERKAREEW